MRKLIIANWKANPKSIKDAKKILNSIKTLKDKEIVICPPYPYIYLLNKKKFSIGAQNSFYNSGSYTGEVSSETLKDLGCKYVIVGHSERREYFSENNEIINKKIKSLIINGITPILCVGESKKDNRTDIIKKQIKEGLRNIDSKKVVIVYEPIWAISKNGKDNPCNPDIAKEILLFIRKYSETRVIYGGSVNGKNAKSYLDVGFDGFLIGKSSLDVKEFNKIIEI